jgi:hypothetical protein
VLDLIDKSYEDMEATAQGQVGSLDTDGRARKKVEFEDIEMSPTSSKGSPGYGGVSSGRLDESQFQIDDGVNGPDESSFV